MLWVDNPHCYMYAHEWDELFHYINLLEIIIFIPVFLATVEIFCVATYGNIEYYLLEK